jgi:hypothetical protein
LWRNRGGGCLRLRAPTRAASGAGAGRRGRGRTERGWTRNACGSGPAGAQTRSRGRSRASGPVLSRAGARGRAGAAAGTRGRKLGACWASVRAREVLQRVIRRGSRRRLVRRGGWCEARASGGARARGDGACGRSQSRAGQGRSRARVRRDVAAELAGDSTEGGQQARGACRDSAEEAEPQAQSSGREKCMPRRRGRAADVCGRCVASRPPADERGSARAGTGRSAGCKARAELGMRPAGDARGSLWPGGDEPTRSISHRLAVACKAMSDPRSPPKLHG